MTRILSVFVLVVVGCSSGFDRGRIKERLEGEERQIDDEDIRAALASKPQVRFPIKVGIVFVEDDRTDRSDRRAVPFRWTDQDRESLLAAWETLRAKGVVSDLFVISPDLVPGNDLRHLRLAAAKHGADSVLVVKGAAQMDRYANPLALLNLTIVGGFLAPGSHRDALFSARCALWDVGNEFLYLTARSEGEAKRQGPTFLIEDEPALDAAKEDALRGINAELVRRLASLKGS